MIIPDEISESMYELPPNIALSPLADPVVNAVFANAETAGQAAESIIQAVLETDSDADPIDKIISVTPQRIYQNASSRGCRVDVEIITQTQEHIIFEIQINPDASIMKRDLFTAAQIISNTSHKGDNPKEMAGKIPRMIFINILGYIIRKDNTDMVQPFKIMYTKPPLEVAVKNSSGYNVQLKRLPELPRDFSNSLYCWCYLLYTADEKKISLREVLELTPELQEYAKTDTGFQQFCDQYQRVADDPDVRKEYFLWYRELMREEGIKEAAFLNGKMNAKEEYELIINEKNAMLAVQDALLSDKDALLLDKDAILADKDAILADKDVMLADKDAEIYELRKRLGIIN